MQKEHTFTVDGLINRGGLYPGGLISGILYSFENGWAYIRGGLKLGGLKVGFYGILCHQIPGPEAMGIRAQNSGVPKAKWPQVKLRNWHAKKIGIANKKVNGTLNFFFLFHALGMLLHMSYMGYVRYTE